MYRCLIGEVKKTEPDSTQWQDEKQWHNWKQEISPLKIKIKLLKGEVDQTVEWLPKQLVDPPPLEALETWLDVSLNNLL